MALINELEKPRQSLKGFADLTCQIFKYLPAVISKSVEVRGYLILSPHKSVQSDHSKIDPDEIVVSVKTTSKDRIGKMFIDKMLLQNFTEEPQKIIGVFHNDVQRKATNNISFTLVSGLFLVYTKFLTELEGVYYLDLPPKAKQAPYNKHIKPFSLSLKIFGHC